MSLDDPERAIAEAQIGMAAHMYRSSQEFQESCAGILAETLIKTINRAAEIDHETTLDVLCAACDGMGAGHPMLGAHQSAWAKDAADWAKRAAPHELVSYATAALTAAQDRTFAMTARKRLMVAIWNSLPDPERAAFIDFIEPGSRAKE